MVLWFFLVILFSGAQFYLYTASQYYYISIGVVVPSMSHGSGSAFSGAVKDFMEYIGVLREIDSVIDLARGWLQLSVLVAIGERSVRVDELVRVLGQPRKAVLDVLRKMRLKGLVEVRDGYYMLSSRGLHVYKLLSSIVNHGGFERRSASGQSYAREATVYDVVSSITRFLYLYEAIVALGSARGYELSLDTLASVVRIGERQLDEYLSVYATGSTRIFERRVKRCGLIARRGCVVYRLTREGLMVFHRLPEYVRVRRSWATRVLVLLTRALHPRIVLKRLTLFLSVGSAMTMSLVALYPELSLLLLGGWVLVVSFLALLVSRGL